MKFLSFFISELASWCDSFIQGLPGRLGVSLRRAYLRRRLGSSGAASVDQGCAFFGHANIRFSDGVSVGRSALFSAEGGAIDVEEDVSFNTNVHINASVGGTIRIGKYSLIGPNTVMRTANHKFERRDIPIRKQGHECGDIDIGEDCWIGANVVVLGGVKIGAGSVIAAGAVVVDSIPAGALAGGVPAKVIRMRDDAK